MATCKHLKWLVNAEGLGRCRCGKTQQFRNEHSSQYNGKAAPSKIAKEQEERLARAVKEAS